MPQTLCASFCDQPCFIFHNLTFLVYLSLKDPLIGDRQGITQLIDECPSSHIMQLVEFSFYSLFPFWPLLRIPCLFEARGAITSCGNIGLIIHMKGLGCEGLFFTVQKGVIQPFVINFLTTQFFMVCHYVHLFSFLGYHGHLVGSCYHRGCLALLQCSALHVSHPWWLACLPLTPLRARYWV